MLFADDAAVTAHTEGALQPLISSFALVARLVSPSVSRRQHPWPRRQQHPKHLHRRLHSRGGEGLHLPRLEHLQQPFPWHWTEQTNLQRSSGRKRVWDNTILIISTKIKVYQACVLSTILYGSETWTPYSRQDRRLNTFQHLASEGFWVSPCKTVSQTRMSLHRRD